MVVGEKCRSDLRVIGVGTCTTSADPEGQRARAEHGQGTGEDVGSAPVPPVVGRLIAGTSRTVMIWPVAVTAASPLAVMLTVRSLSLIHI